MSLVSKDTSTRKVLLLKILVLKILLLFSYSFFTFVFLQILSQYLKEVRRVTARAEKK